MSRAGKQKQNTKALTTDSIVTHDCRNGMAGTLHVVASGAICTGLAYPDMVIQRILRHANVSTTATYYIKTVAEDVRNAMVKLENNIPQTQSDTQGTPSVQASPTPAALN